MKIAVQLYTLRNELEKDFVGTLRKVKELGYEGVEFAGFYNIPKEEMRALLNELGLVAVGSHTSFELLEKNFDEVVSYNEAINNRNIIVPWSTLNTENLEDIVEKLSNFEKALSDKGFRLHYHNHDFEFATLNGEYLLDLLFKNIPSMYAEIDTHWVKRAGLDPISYLQKYQGRNTLVHLKDLVTENGNSDFAPLGMGIMDLEGIINQAKANQVEAIVVENDQPKNGGIFDITISIKYLKEKL